MMLEKREGKREGSIDTIRVQITDIVLGSKFSNGLKICYNAKRSINMMLRKREGIETSVHRYQLCLFTKGSQFQIPFPELMKSNF